VISEESKQESSKNQEIDSSGVKSENVCISDQSSEN
jgi:hypothetical protein